MVRVVKVSHANAILQLVDHAYAAAQELAKKKIVDDRETNPQLGFKSIASIFHAPAGIQIQAGLRDS